ncbi:hypothetical protein GT348_05600 [Aristophania vespae]|uniref:Uncharacterized protein n=1 Tax=Aristophania vespae TaxID=2697033 RepID=A0A6P1NGY9_9PROT|nr:hypothetical protein [Aristophania vespae]QHI95790.1 hypothetical protein GT348_05600 [Aristophania vespae]UMM63495.1 hypothetical protein DM15PD_04690 [Aristophania vespae]
MLDPFPYPVIDISSQNELKRLLSLQNEKRITIISPPYAGHAFGLPWWQTLIKDCPFPTILDCGASAALALAALEDGIHGVICRDFYSLKPSQYSYQLLTKRPDTLSLKDYIKQLSSS